MTSLRSPLPVLAACAVLLTAAVGTPAPAPAAAPVASATAELVVAPSAERVSTTRAGERDPVVPGSTVQRAVRVTNRGVAPAVVDVGVASAAAARDGSLVELSSRSTAGAAAWVTLDRRSVTIPSGATRQVAVRVQVPRTAPAGSHPFAVTVTRTSSSGTAFRQVAIFVLELPGAARPHVRITGASLRERRDGRDEPARSWHVILAPGGRPHLRAEWTLENSGARLVDVRGELRVRSALGRTRRTPVERVSLLPGGAAPGHQDLHHVGGLGVYHVDLVALDPVGARTLHSYGRVIVVPVWALFVVLLVVVLMSRAVRRLRRRVQDPLGASG